MMGTARKLDTLPGMVPVLYSPGLKDEARRISDYLTTGHVHLGEIFNVEPPSLQAILLSEEDWQDAPRESERPYPFGLPYFTRSAEVPTLVFPSELSEAIRPQTNLTLPLTVWHELAHAFFLQNEVVKAPLWLGEMIPQTASAAVALREGLLMDDHLSRIESPEFTVRGFNLPASAGDQMSFQNLLLAFGVAVIQEFGDGFLSRLIHALWNESEVVDEERAEELFALSLGKDSREWLTGRPEFGEAS